MTNKDLMQSLLYMRRLLYGCPFGGDQMMTVSECIRVLDKTLTRINDQQPDVPIDSTQAPVGPKE